MPKHKNTKPLRGRRAGGRQRHLSVRTELRKEPDLHKIARAVIGLAMAQAERDAAEGANEMTISDLDETPKDQPHA